MRRCAIMAVLALAFAGVAAPAGERVVVPDDSLFAIVTHKAGIASGLAHDHFIAASDYEVGVTFDPEAPEATRVAFRVDVADLVVDDPAVTARWQPRVLELGLLDEPFAEVSDKDRAKIRRTMLSRKQLDAERHPEIRGEILDVAPIDDADFPYRATIAIEVHGERVERDVRARFAAADDGYVLEAVGRFAFSEFAIEPYSAFLGTVKNRDGWDLLVRVRLRSP